MGLGSDTRGLARNAPSKPEDLKGRGVCPMSKQREIHWDQVKQALEAVQDVSVGFLPATAPLHTLPYPYEELSVACEKLAGRYHGLDQDCRPWLDELFTDPRPEWLSALETASDSLLENLMTKVSLLCHAYRWQRMPTPSENYALENIKLPTGLESLWSDLALRLGVPRVGNFYTMVANNWVLQGVAPGSRYKVEQLSDQTVDLVHSWLLPPLHEELRTFVVTALCIESRGAKILAHIKEIHDCVGRSDEQEATYHLTFLAATLLGITSDFNRSIKKARIAPHNFLTYVQPTMIWLLDHGDGPLEGASGPQSCTIQLLDSFLGVPRSSELGGLILKARAYMMPRHRQLLEVMDSAGEILREFVVRSASPRLLEAYNRCLSTMRAWRVSHQKRGAMYIEGDEAKSVEHYVSTGLVVQDDQNRTQVFEEMMEAHIEATQSRTLVSEWSGKERGLDYLFRFLSPSQRETLDRKTETLKVLAGESIISQGELFPGLFVLLNGSAEVIKKSEGRKFVVDAIRGGEIFGEMSLVENLPASASIVATEDLEVQQVSLETVYDLIEENREAEADFYLALAQLLSHRLRHRPSS